MKDSSGTERLKFYNFADTDQGHADYERFMTTGQLPEGARPGTINKYSSATEAEVEASLGFKGGNLFGAKFSASASTEIYSTSFSVSETTNPDGSTSYSATRSDPAGTATYSRGTDGKITANYVMRDLSPAAANDIVQAMVEGEPKITDNTDIVLRINDAQVARWREVAANVEQNTAHRPFHDDYVYTPYVRRMMEAENPAQMQQVIIDAGHNGHLPGLFSYLRAENGNRATGYPVIGVDGQDLSIQYRTTVE